MEVSWDNIDEVFKACEKSKIYKNVTYDKLLETVERMLGPDPRKASKVEDDKMQGAATDCEDNDDEEEAETGGDTVTEGMVAMIREIESEDAASERKTAKEPKKSKAVDQETTKPKKSQPP